VSVNFAIPWAVLCSVWSAATMLTTIGVVTALSTKSVESHWLFAFAAMWVVFFGAGMLLGLAMLGSALPSAPRHAEETRK